MLCRASVKQAKWRENPSRCQWNTEANRSEATARQMNRADVWASENIEGSYSNSFKSAGVIEAVEKCDEICNHEKNPFTALEI